MQSSKTFSTTDEIFELVSAFESKIQTAFLFDPLSTTCVKLLKKLMLLCNSVSISLIQNEQLEETISLLKSADNADLHLQRFGKAILSWQGRLMTPSILAFLYFKQHRFTDSLKFLFKALTLAQEIKEAGIIIHIQIKTLLHILAFMVLWKLSRYSEAEKYLLSIPELNMESTRTRNLFGLIEMAKAGLVIKKSKEFFFAVKICEETLEKIEPDEVTYDLVRDLISAVYAELKTQSSDDWLLTNSFVTVFYISCFIPLIAPGTPMVKPLQKIVKEPVKKYLRPAYSASRTRSDIPVLAKPFIEELRINDIAPLTTRRSTQNTSYERNPASSVRKSSLNLSTARVHGLKLAYFSPRITQTRPKSSRVSLKKSK